MPTHPASDDQQQPSSSHPPANGHKVGNNPSDDDQQYPGYPHYAPGEDIMNAAGAGERAHTDVENLSPSNRNNNRLPDMDLTATAQSDDAGDGLVSDAEAPDEDGDVSAEERALLEAADSSMPTIDDNQLREARLDDTDDDGELLNEATSATDVNGDDLDVPGSGEDDADDAIGEEDEENNCYSLGGDRMENLEEPRE